MEIEQVTALPGWNTSSNLRHDRLVWLAARPGLDREHRRWWHLPGRLLRARMDSRRYWRPGAPDREDLSDSIRRASIAVDGLAGRFAADERDRLRGTGRLPDWFWPSYRTEFAALKRR